MRRSFIRQQASRNSGKRTLHKTAMKSNKRHTVQDDQSGNPLSIVILSFISLAIFFHLSSFILTVHVKSR